MRARLRADGRMRDAALVCVLAYAGLRPGEALALEWQNVGDRRILVEGAVSLGAVKDTKTRQTRSVRLLAPLATELAEWRLACGRPDAKTLVFPGRGGRPWADHDWRNGANASMRRLRPRFISMDPGPTTFGTRSARC
jgi:integrase